MDILKSKRFNHWPLLYLIVLADSAVVITYYEDRQVIDYIYFVTGVAVYLLRVTAWIRLRTMRLAAE